MSSGPLGKNAREEIRDGKLWVITTNPSSGKERKWYPEEYTKMYNRLRKGQESKGGRKTVSTTVPKSNSRTVKSNGDSDGKAGNRKRGPSSHDNPPPAKSYKTDSAVVRTLEALTERVASLSEKRPKAKPKTNARSNTVHGKGRGGGTTGHRNTAGGRSQPPPDPQPRRGPAILRNVQEEDFEPQDVAPGVQEVNPTGTFSLRPSHDMSHNEYGHFLRHNAHEANKHALVTLTGYKAEPDDEDQLELLKGEDPVKTDIATSPQLLTDLGVLVADRSVTTFLHITDEFAIDKPYRMGEDSQGKPRQYDIYTDKILVGEFDFPVNHSEIFFSTDFKTIPYIQEFSTILNEDLAYDVVLLNMQNAVKKGYVQQQSVVDVEVCVRTFFMSEPPNMEDFKNIIEVDGESPKYQAIIDENVFDDRGFQRRQDLRPTNEDKIIAMIDQCLHKRLSIKQKVGFDAFVYEPLEIVDTRSGYVAGEGVNTYHQEDSIYGYFCPDGKMYVMAHYTLTSMNVPDMSIPVEERAFPEQSTDLLGVLTITKALSYDVKINWVATYWNALALEQSPFFTYDVPDEEEDGTLVYPDTKLMKEWETPDYEIIDDDEPDIHVEGVQFVRNDVRTSRLLSQQMRQIHHRGVYCFLHPKQAYTMDHMYIHHRTIDKDHVKDMSALMAFAKHRDFYFKRQGLTQLYAQARRNKAKMILHKNALTTTSLGISFNDIMGGIFSGVREVTSTMQQFAPLAEFATALLAPEPDMFLSSRRDYYKKLSRKPFYNGLLYPFRYRGSRRGRVQGDLGGHEDEITMMNLPLMGSQPVVTQDADGSSVEVNGFAMESEYSPSAAVLEVIDPISNEPEVVKGVRAYVRDPSTSDVTQDHRVGLTIPMCGKSSQGLTFSGHGDIEQVDTDTITEETVPYSTETYTTKSGNLYTVNDRSILYNTTGTLVVSGTPFGYADESVTGGGEWNNVKGKGFDMSNLDETETKIINCVKQDIGNIEEKVTGNRKLANLIARNTNALAKVHTALKKMLESNVAAALVQPGDFYTRFGVGTDLPPNLSDLEYSTQVRYNIIDGSPSSASSQFFNISLSIQLSFAGKDVDLTLMLKNKCFFEREVVYNKQGQRLLIGELNLKSLWSMDAGNMDYYWIDTGHAMTWGEGPDLTAKLMVRGPQGTTDDNDEDMEWKITVGCMEVSFDVTPGYVAVAAFWEDFENEPRIYTITMQKNTYNVKPFIFFTWWGWAGGTIRAANEQKFWVTRLEAHFDENPVIYNLRFNDDKTSMRPADDLFWAGNMVTAEFDPVQDNYWSTNTMADGESFNLANNGIWTLEKFPVEDYLVQ